MLWKVRDGSVQKERLEVLLRRWTGKIEEMEKEYRSVCAGISGEARFDAYLAGTELTVPHAVLQDVRIFAGSWIQMDSVVVLPWCVLLFEVKNIAGRLQFTAEPRQLIRTTADGIVEGLQSPVDQLERTGWAFRMWLDAQGFQLPVRPVLVISHPKQIVEQAPAGLTTIFSHQVPLFFRKLKAEPAILDEKGIAELAALLVRAHQPYRPKPICEDQRYPVDRMRRGVWCEACGRVGMKRAAGKWVCPCGVASRNAHLRTLRDWAFLTGEPLTNKKCREILGVDNRDLAYRILKELKLERSGTFKDANYRMKW